MVPEWRIEITTDNILAALSWDRLVAPSLWHCRGSACPAFKSLPRRICRRREAKPTLRGSVESNLMVHCSPTPPQPLPEIPFEDVEVPELRLRREEVYAQMANVCDKWDIIGTGSGTASDRVTKSSERRYSREALAPSPLPPDEESDNIVLILLHATTQAIRTAQRFVHSLPPDVLPTTSSTSHSSASQRSFRPPGLGVITSARPIPRHSTVGKSSPAGLTSPPKIDKASSSMALDDDPLRKLRIASLDALGALKDMERRYRLPVRELSDVEQVRKSMHLASIGDESRPQLDLYDDSSETSSTIGSSSGGHLYQVGVQLHDLKAESAEVQNWIAVVDDLLSRVAKRERAPEGEAPPSDEAESPEWAKMGLFKDDPLGNCAGTMPRQSD